MKKDLFALKGTICYSKNQKELVFAENSYEVCENGLCAGVFSQLPEEYKDIPVKDMGDRLIIPGFTDLHLHAPQYAYRGTGMDLELLDWLNTITFPQEAKYADLSYAKKAYSIFVDDLKHSFTTRACIFATLHRPATELLMDMLEESGLTTMVGKVNMDRNGAPELQEKSAQASAQDTRQWLEEIKGRYDHTYPILTPRFTPSCTDELMTELGKIQREYHIPIQSHLSENFGEIAWVKELCPTSRFYGDAYDMFGLFGTKPAANEEVSNPASASSNTCPTIMAHCVHSTDEEIQMIKDQGVYVAHCPESNTDIASGIAPVRRYLDMGLHVGLGTFRPVKVDDVTKHTMHTEHYIMPQETADLINETKKNGGRVISVGTTSCRTLESVATKNGCICADEDDTSIFIYPGYEFKCMDALITNFHLPESTLIMLVSAFAGFDNIMNAYNTAVKEKYRFFSFGDAMFIH